VILKAMHVLCGKDQLPTTTHNDFRSLRISLGALSGLLKYLGFLGDTKKYSPYTISIGHPGDCVQYGSTVLTALSILPCRYLSQLDGSLLNGLHSAEISGEKTPASIFEILNQTMTAMGSRKLKRWLLSPLTNYEEIKRRQNITLFFVSNTDIRCTLQKKQGGLRNLPDFEKLASKLLDVPPLATLFDLFEIYKGLMSVQKVIDCLNSVQEKEALEVYRFCHSLKQLFSDFKNYFGLIEECVDLDAFQKTGFKRIFLNASFDAALSNLQDQILKTEAELEASRIQLSRDLEVIGDKLKLEKAEPYGYVYRLTRKDEKFLHGDPGKHNLQVVSRSKTGVMFSTDSSRLLALRLSNLQEKYGMLQKDILSEILIIALTYCESLKQIGSCIAELDVLLSFAHVTAKLEWCQPDMIESSSVCPREMEIQSLRHPIVEAKIGHLCIPNDIKLSNTVRMSLITGPNCGGKSTYLRAVGIVCFLAQVGCFVPASSAKIPIFHKFFARVGASDNQMRGVSTFMAEMLDTSLIVRNADENSLVLIDELGRGTSTFDGYGIAWAIATRLLDLRCFCLFATHFHELTTLENESLGLKNQHVSAALERNNLTLLYKVGDGSCTTSCGLHVAKITAFPTAVIAEAEVLLNLSTSSTVPSPLKKRKQRTEDSTMPPYMHKLLQTLSPTDSENSTNTLVEEGTTKTNTFDAFNKLEKICREYLNI